MGRIIFKTTSLLTAAILTGSALCGAQTQTDPAAATCPGTGYSPDPYFVGALIRSEGVDPASAQKMACQEITGIVEGLAEAESAIRNLRQREAEVTARMRPLSLRSRVFRTGVYPALVEKQAQITRSLISQQFAEFTLCQNVKSFLTEEKRGSLCGKMPDVDPRMQNPIWRALSLIGSLDNNLR
jgi:hypothetical protein